MVFTRGLLLEKCRSCTQYTAQQPRKSLFSTNFHLLNCMFVIAFPWRLKYHCHYCLAKCVLLVLGTLACLDAQPRFETKCISHQPASTLPARSYSTARGFAPSGWNLNIISSINTRSTSQCLPLCDRNAINNEHDISFSSYENANFWQNRCFSSIEVSQTVHVI